MQLKLTDDSIAGTSELHVLVVSWPLWWFVGPRQQFALHVHD